MQNTTDRAADGSSLDGSGMFAWVAHSHHLRLHALDAPNAIATKMIMQDGSANTIILRSADSRYNWRWKLEASKKRMLRHAPQAENESLARAKLASTAFAFL